MHKSTVQASKKSKRDKNVDNDKKNVQQQIYVAGDSTV